MPTTLMIVACGGAGDLKMANTTPTRNCLSATLLKSADYTAIIS